MRKSAYICKHFSDMCELPTSEMVPRENNAYANALSPWKNTCVPQRDICKLDDDDELRFWYYVARIS